ncbi:MAG: hypothetical protein JO191_10410 [Mycobacteriaceae bacterium]|nr:hypothetical protein [Mycobacteriaceae bacterium]MBV9514235.1 hypothetical protein [Mycobacteriaceae bacterium]
MTIPKPRTQRAWLALGVAATAPAVLFVGAGTARADTASVQFQPVTDSNNTPGLQVTVNDTSGNGNPGTFGACVFNANPVMGTMNFIQGFNQGFTAPLAPLNQGFQLDQGGQQQLNFTPQVPMGTIWNVNITCTDPVQNQTGTIYNEPMPF